MLLIDEIDRADDEFEAFLLELLSDFQVTIPEIGTIRAKRRPRVILTSNRTRELHDALKRRCLYHWIGHPSLEREIEIVRARVPGVPERLADEAAAFVQQLRELDLAKAPGVAETIDWTQALLALGQQELDAERRRRHAGLGAEVPRGRRAGARRRPARAGGRGARGAMSRGDAVARKLVTFGRILREAGLEVGPGRLQDALRGLTWSTSPPASRSTTRCAARWSRATTTSSRSTPPSPPSGSARRWRPTSGAPTSGSSCRPRRRRWCPPTPC